MAIKHADHKEAGDKGKASEWNKDHVIDSDVDFDNNKITNLAEPTEEKDGANKKYVDSENNYCKVSRMETTQNIPSGAFFNDISFSTEHIDPSDMWSASDPTKVYIKSPGTYLIIGYFAGTAGAMVTGNLQIHITATNESYSLPMNEAEILKPEPNEYFATRSAVILGLTSSSVVQMRIWNATGSTITAKASLAVYKLRP
jgi:hypothetical protein